MEELFYCLLLPVTPACGDEATLVNNVFKQWQTRPLKIVKREKSRVVKTPLTKVAEKRDTEQRMMRQIILELLAHSKRPTSTKEILHNVYLQSGVQKIPKLDLNAVLNSLCDAGHICKARRGKKNVLWSLCEAESINEGL